MTVDPHVVLKRTVGEAARFPCVGCARPACDWAYQHNGPPEAVTSYAPMCRSCHRKLDHQKSEVLQRAWAKSRWSLTLEDQRAGGRAAPHPGQPLTHEQAVSMGARGGTARAKRIAADSVLRERLRRVAAANFSPENQRRTCSECGLTSTPAGIGNHQKHTDHRRYRKG